MTPDIATAVLDAAPLATILEGYRQLVETNRAYGHHDLADRCERRLSALLYGGRVTLGEAI